MAEVITAVGLTASIAQLIGTTAKAYKYLNDVKNAPKERSKLSLEAANLLPLLNSLRDQVENVSPNDPWIESVVELGGPAGPLELFKRTMEQLKRKLKVESPMLRMGKHLVWTLDKEEIRRILADIERFKTRLGLALQKDNFRLSRAIKEDTAGIQPINRNIAEIRTLTTGIVPLHRDVSGIKKDTAGIEPMGETVNYISENVDTLHANDRAQADASLLKDVLVWLSPLDFRRNHASAAEARIDGTGRWFLDCAEFRRWRDSNQETLYCPGIPGAGKTVIASLVIDHLYTEHTNESTPVIYAYCYYKERSLQSLRNILGGLLKQLLSLRNTVPADIKALYELYQGRHQNGTPAEISKLLRAELTQYRKVFIIVDALDEYSENQNDCDSLLAEIEQLRACSNMMLTSRFVAPWIDAFGGASRVTIAAKDRDVRRYLESQIPSLPKFVKADKDLQELIVQTITEAVGGMFLLASLHMQSLKDKVSLRKIKEALTQLPRGSGSAASKIAYDETMNRIRRQEKGFCDLAIATLSWISLAIRPLNLRELQCALSVEPGDTEMDVANFVDEETLSCVCAGLIVVDQESQIVRLAHYTTQEYFESQKDVLFLEEQKLLATTCLTYLSFDVFSDWQLVKYGISRWLSKPPSFLRAPGHDYPLLNYAVSHWHEHAHSSQDPAIQKLIINYLKRTDNLAALFPFFGLDDNGRALAESFSTQSVHGLLIAAKYGFTDAVKTLLHLEGYCAEDKSRIKAQALNLAASFGQSAVVCILLDGNTIAPAEVSFALWCMYCRDILPPSCCEVAEILLNHGADANTTLHNKPLIHRASGRNDVQFAVLLLAHGADVELRDWDGWTALHQAAGGGHSGDIVKLLLENGLDINARNNEGETALLTAVRLRPPGGPKEYRSFVTQLLESGASVNEPDIVGCTALHWAANYGWVKIACQLLETGADVNARARHGKTAADFSSPWRWGSMTEEERDECKKILERYSFYKRGEKSSTYDNKEVTYDSDEVLYDSDEVAYDSDEDLGL